MNLICHSFLKIQRLITLQFYPTASITKIHLRYLVIRAHDEDIYSFACVIDLAVIFS